MAKGIKLSKAQRKALKRRLAVTGACAITVISMGTNSLNVYAKQNTSQNITLERQTSVPLMSSAAPAEGTYTKIDISAIGVTDNERVCEINQNGTYLLTGSNYVSDVNNPDGSYVPTSIRVKEGVKATLYLDGVSIKNKNGSGSNLPPSSFGETIPDKKATLPMLIGANAEVELELLNDSEFAINQNGAAFEIAENATVTLAPSSHSLTIKEESSWGDCEAFAMNLYGTFVMNGSHLVIDGKNYGISLSDPSKNPFGYSDLYTGKMVINGGFFECDKEGILYSSDMQSHFEINGGMFNSGCMDDWYISNNNGNCLHNIVSISGLEAGKEVSMCYQYYKKGDEKRDYITDGITTDASGNIYIDIGQHNLALDSDKENFAILLKCGDKYYEARYTNAAKEDSHCMEAKEVSSPVYKINFYSAEENHALLDSVYTTVDSDGKAVYHMAGDYEHYAYTFSLHPDMSDEYDFVFDTASSDAETNVYVKIEPHEQTITVESGMPDSSYSIKYGESIPDKDSYIFVNSETHQIWDGIAVAEIKVRAYPAVTIDGEKYVRIDSTDTLNKLKNDVNAGCTALNGYLETDIDAGNFAGIGTENYCYAGKFLGNGHTVTLAVTETEGRDGCAMFSYVDSGCEISKLIIAGTINTNGKYAGGIVGICKASENKVILDSCRSSVDITYTPGGVAYCGGLVGEVKRSGRDDGYITLRGCLYTGAMKSGNAGMPLTGQGGFIGYISVSSVRISIDGCYVDATFDEGDSSNSRNSLIGGHKYEPVYIDAYNFFYDKKTCASEYGEEYDGETMGVAELAWILNSRRTDDGFTNAEVWSYSDGKIIYADAEHLPIYRVSFVDKGMFSGKDKFAAIYRYTTPDSPEIPAAEIPEGFLSSGQSASWMVGDTEYSSRITGDTEAVLAIEDTNSYTITIDGAYTGSFENLRFGTKIEDLVNDGKTYVFVSKNLSRVYTCVDGLDTEFTAYEIKDTGYGSYFEIDSTDSLKAFAIMVNSGLTDIGARLTTDIDVSGIPDFVIGDSSEHAYKGNFYGDGHTITVGIVEENSVEATGLFRYADNRVQIERLTIDGSIKSAARYIGGIVGYYNSAYGMGSKGIANCCTSLVSIETTGENTQYVGGIVGYSDNSMYVLASNRSGQIGIGAGDHFSGMLGYAAQSGNKVSGCYVHPYITATGNMHNFVYWPEDEAENRNYEIVNGCYYDVEGVSKQGTYSEHISYENIYAMNRCIQNYHSDVSYNNMSYYDSEAKCVKYTDSTHGAPCWVELLPNDSVYTEKKYEGGSAYTDCYGHLLAPDMTDFLLPGHTVHWYRDGVEITDTTKLYEEDRLYLQITSDKEYSIALTGDSSETLTGLHYGDTLPEDYLFISDSGKSISRVDGTQTALKAYRMITVDNVRYLEISSYERLCLFRDQVDSGFTTLNGMLTADIETGSDFGMIGGSFKGYYYPYQGCFDGNGHTITINVSENDKSDGTSLFGYLGEGAVIRNLMTSGTVVSNGKFCGGIVGNIQGSCTIENCGSDISFTFILQGLGVVSLSGDAIYGDCTYGGIVGLIKAGDVKITNCWFTGSFAQEGFDKLEGQGGLVGWREYPANLSVSNCFVAAQFAADRGENFVRNLYTDLVNCYYLNACGESTQGTKISAEELADAAFAYKLNTFAGEKSNSGVFTYVEGEKYPRLAAGEYKAISKVTFADAEKDSEYAAAWTEGYSVYTDCEGHVLLPDMSAYIEDDDRALWYNGENVVDSNTVFETDAELELVIQYGRTKKLAELHKVYDEAVLIKADEQKYTTASYADFEAVLAEAKTLLALEESACTEEMITACLDKLNTATAGLTEAAGILSVKPENGESAVLSGAGRYAAGDMVTLKASDVEGRKFVGWYQGDKLVSESAEYSFEFADAGNVEYTAKYRNLYRYTVSFDAAGATGSMTAVTVIEGETFTFPENGFTAPKEKKFKCWEYEAAGEIQQAQAGDVCAITADMTVKAVWIDARVDYALTLKAENGVNAVLSGAGRYAVGELVNLTASEVSGCRFVGWYQGDALVSASKECRFEFAAAADTEYTAKYRNLYRYTVSFDAAGATGSMTAVTVIEDETFTFPENGFTAPKGKKFKCWEYVIAGAEKQAQAGENCAVSGNMTVTAVWTAEETGEQDTPPVTPVTPGEQDTPSVTPGEQDTPSVTPVVTPGENGTSDDTENSVSDREHISDKDEDEKTTLIIDDINPNGENAGDIASVIEKTVADGKTDAIIINLKNTDDSEPEAESRTLTLGSNVFEILSKSDVAALTVSTDAADIEFNSDVIASIAEQNAGDVKLTVKQTDGEASGNEADEDRVSFEISLTGEDGKEIEFFDGAYIEVTVQVPESLRGKDVVMVYSDGENHYSPVEGTLNPDGTYTFRTRHLSEYILMTSQDAEKLYNYINDFGTLKAHVKDRTDSTVTVDWDLYKDADGYIVYGNKCNHDGKKYKVKKVATIKDPTKTEYTVTGLESGTYYKFTIKAYKVVDGKKYVTVKSYYVHGSTSGGKQRVTSEIEIDSTGMKKANSVTLKKGKSYSVNAKRYNEKNKKVSHSDIRYESSDTAVATVSKKGKITATGKGKCTILVIAENGIYEEIKVTVK